MAQSTDSSVEVGQIVAGKYRLEQQLGKGGMGTVWRALHMELGSPVALKLLKPEIGKNANSRARFLREAKAAAMLRSAHVVQIFEHGSDGDLIYIAMELLEGETLLSRLKRERYLSPDVTITVMTHVGRAMTKAHEQGIVHRDLKPENIFLVANDDEIIAKVLDFGIAKSSSMTLSGSSGEGPYTQTGALLGTPYYMSPEQATGDKSIDHRTDLWAMGVIAFECLVGRRPYQSDSLGDLVLQICSKAQPVPSKLGPHPPAFDAWFQRAQKRLPSERFQSAKELIRALRQALAVSARASLDVVDDSAGDDSPFHSGAEQPAETLDAFTATTQPRRRPWLFGVVAVVMLLAAAVGGWGLARSGDGSQATPGEVSSSELDGPPTAPEPAGQPSTEPSTEPSGEGTDLRAAGSAAASASASADVAAPAKPVPAAPRPRAPGPAPPRRPPPPPSDPLAI